MLDVPQAFDAITDELGRQYSLGYYPKARRSPVRRRDIKVRTRSPNLVVRARESYVATASACAADRWSQTEAKLIRGVTITLSCRSRNVIAAVCSDSKFRFLQR